MDKLMISKQRVFDILDGFPDTIIVEDFIDRLMLIAKVEADREQIKNGEYLTQEELYEEMKKW